MSLRGRSLKYGFKCIRGSLKPQQYIRKLISFVRKHGFHKIRTCWNPRKSGQNCKDKLAQDVLLNLSLSSLSHMHTLTQTITQPLSLSETNCATPVCSFVFVFLKNKTHFSLWKKRIFVPHAVVPPDVCRWTFAISPAPNWASPLIASVFIFVSSNSIQHDLRYLFLYFKQNRVISSASCSDSDRPRLLVNFRQRMSLRYTVLFNVFLKNKGRVFLPIVCLPVHCSTSPPQTMGGSHGGR